MLSCKAEYIAAMTVTCQGIQLRQLLAKMLGTTTDVAELRINNKSAIALCKNPIFHDWSKHIGVRYHYSRKCANEGHLTVTYTATSEQLTDILTKALGHVRFHELRIKIGIQSAGGRVRD
jgi:hypothetical protein